MKQPKIVIIGFGSIGQRHYRNLKQLGLKEVFVYDIAEIEDKEVNTLDKITEESLSGFDVAFICNPNNLHIEAAIKCAEAGCHLFIEKPLSHNLKNIDKLENICRKNKLISLVACNMRFHPALKYIKNYLDSERLGKIYGIHHECGWYLPYWRPKQDYRKNYAAKKSMGGGIILDDIHEFDLLFWLNDFASVKQASLVFDKVSDLEIETEDNCLASFKFSNKVLGSVRCDYLQQRYTRRCMVVGEKGNLEWDFKENIIWLYTNEKSRKLYEIENYDLNRMYIDELKYFLQCVNNKQTTFNGISQAAKVLKYCLNKT